MLLPTFAIKLTAIECELVRGKTKRISSVWIRVYADYAVLVGSVTFLYQFGLSLPSICLSCCDNWEVEGEESLSHPSPFLRFAFELERESLLRPAAGCRERKPVFKTSFCSWQPLFYGNCHRPSFYATMWKPVLKTSSIYKRKVASGDPT